jgi:hypothetical protein
MDEEEEYHIKISNFKCLFHKYKCFENIPPEYKTKDLCYFYINKYKKYDEVDENFFDIFPSSIKDQDFYINCYEINPTCFQYMPNTFIDRNFYLHIVYNIGFEDVPEEYLDYDFYLKSVISSPVLFCYIPEKMQNDNKFIKKAIYENSRAIGYIPKNKINYKLASHALKQNSTNFEYLQNKYKTFKFLSKNIFLDPYIEILENLRNPTLEDLKKI